MPPHLMQGDINLNDYEVRKFRINVKVFIKSYRFIL